MAATNQNIRNFYKQAQDNDFSRDFLFRVTDMELLGMKLGDGSPGSGPDLVYVKTANLPGRAITNVATPYMGLNFNIPGNTTYPGSDNYQLTFYLDAQGKLRQQFETASRNLFDDTTSTGSYGTSTEDDFITLALLNKQLERVAEYKLVGASIRTINDISYNMAAGTGQTVEVTCTIAYHFYQESNTEIYDIRHDLATDYGSYVERAGDIELNP